MSVFTRISALLIAIVLLAACTPAGTAVNAPTTEPGETSAAPAVTGAAAQPTPQPAEELPAEPVAAPSETPEPVMAFEPLTSKASDHSGRVTRALIGGQWVYVEDNKLYSIPLDAPDDVQPALIWADMVFPFFLAWGDGVFIFAYPPSDDASYNPMRGMLLNPADGGSRVYDVRQKYFYFPVWTQGDWAYGIGEGPYDARRLNRTSGATEHLTASVHWAGACADYYFFWDQYYGRGFVRRADDPSGPDCETTGEWTFLCSVGDGALLDVQGDLVLLSGGKARLLFEDFAYTPAGGGWSESLTPDYALFTVDEAADALGRRYTGPFLVGQDGVTPLGEAEESARPVSHEGGAVLFPGANALETTPAESYPLYDFFPQK